MTTTCRLRGLRRACGLACALFFVAAGTAQADAIDVAVSTDPATDRPVTITTSGTALRHPLHLLGVE